jgi:uncharacterized protein (TIGR02266 family)
MPLHPLIRSGNTIRRPARSWPAAGIGSMTKVLIVDEAEILLKLERSCLRRSGIDLQVAGNTEDLVFKARQNAPDLVVLHSKGQGELCGTDCVRRLKADPATAGIPVVLIRPADSSPEGTPFPCERILKEPLLLGDLPEAISSLTGVRPRIEPRVQVCLPVEIRSEHSTLHGRTKDLSSSGLFILTQRPMETGLAVQVEVSVPGTRGPSVVTSRGIVVRGVRDNPASYLVPGNAIRLLELDEKGRQTLDEFVSLQGGSP